MIGKAAKVKRLAVILAVGGSSDCTRASAALTRCQRLEHVDLPGEEEVDFDGAAAGDRLHPLEPLHRVQRLFDRRVTVTCI